MKRFIPLVLILMGCYTGPSAQENRDNGYVDIDTCKEYGWCLRAEEQRGQYPDWTLFNQDDANRHSHQTGVALEAIEPDEPDDEQPGRGRRGRGKGKGHGKGKGGCR